MLFGLLQAAGHCRLLLPAVDKKVNISGYVSRETYPLFVMPRID